jgi:Ni/Co efflux regulator RcnB
VKRFLIAASIAALVALPAAAEAKNGNGNDHGKGNSSGGFWGSSSKWQDSDKPKSRHNDKDILRSYVIGEYKRHCPPGLAKKNPPCVPPGQAKKYGVGATLPRGGFDWVPDDVVSLLTPPPPRMRYARVDKNVYLIADGTRKVVEAFELFSAFR